MRPIGFSIDVNSLQPNTGLFENLGINNISVNVYDYSGLDVLIDLVHKGISSRFPYFSVRFRKSIDLCRYFKDECRKGFLDYLKESGVFKVTTTESVYNSFMWESFGDLLLIENNDVSSKSLTGGTYSDIKSALDTFEKSRLSFNIVAGCGVDIVINEAYLVLVNMRRRLHQIYLENTDNHIYKYNLHKSIETLNHFIDEDVPIIVELKDISKFHISNAFSIVSRMFPIH